MHGLKVAGIDLDRKVLADIAVRDAEGFAAIAKQVQGALKKSA
jgi:large subunit ribosomal protein L20